MKNLFIITPALLFLLNSCNPPERARYPNAVQASNPIVQPVPGTPSPTTEQTGNQENNNQNNSNINSEVQPGFESCNTTPSFYNAGIGYLSVCRHSTIETKIRAGFTTTDQSQGTCFIPLFKDPSGNSTYLGNPQCTKHNNGDVMYGDLTKNRQGFTQYAINGVMVLKYNSTQAFYQCMNAFNLSFNACSSACYNNPYCLSTCQANASQYMLNQCNIFKNNHAYIDIKF